MTDYKNVFKPLVLRNGVVLKNRICYSNGQQTFSASPSNGPDELMMTDLAMFARSGASLMSWGHFGSMGGGAAPRPKMEIDKKAIRASGKRVVTDSPFPGPGTAAAYDYSDGRTWNMIGQAAQTAHLYDTRILVKLGAAFPKGKCLNGIEEFDERLIFPLPTAEKDIRFTVPNDATSNPMYTVWMGIVGAGEKAPTMEQLKAKIATKEEIHDAIEDVVDMCQRYKNAGFDGMSIRGDRWGVNACTNIREDEYGGEIEGRGRFMLELFTKIKEVCGPKFLIEVVMPGDSTHGHDGQLPHGYTEEEFIRLMRLLEDVIDIVEIREPIGCGYQCLGYNSQLHSHVSAGIAKDLRAAGFTKAIAVNGGYHDPDEMEEILAEGSVDLISTVRSFRAEPNFMEKLRSGGAEAPTPCIRCNKCHGSYEGRNVCSVNPKDSLNHRIPLIVNAPKRSKKVAVIGGGLIGMRTACLAAERGHHVTVFEKDSKLGGKAAYYSPIYPGLWPINRYLNWLIGETERRGVEVRLNTAPEPEDLKQEGYEAVIACTGSQEKRPPIKGADAPGVWKNEDIYYGNVEPGNQVVIVGGGVVSTETAMYLASRGKDVTVLSRQEILMKNCFYPHGPYFGNLLYVPELGYGREGPCWTKYDNLKPIYNAFTKKITPHSATYVKDGKEQTIEADTVLVSGGFEPLLDEAMRYSEITPEFYTAGDVRFDCSCLMQGNYTAYGRAIML